MPHSSPVDALYPAMLAAFSQSIANTFEQMVFLPATVGQPVDKTEGLPTGCISGTIGLGGSYNGTEMRAKLSLIFSESLAQRIFRSMMMMDESTPVDMAELRDVVGELTNMTAGGAKTILSDEGFKLSLSLPTVAVGQDHYLGVPSGSLSKVVPVTINEDIFHYELSVS